MLPANLESLYRGCSYRHEVWEVIDFIRNTWATAAICRPPGPISPCSLRKQFLPPRDLQLTRERYEKPDERVHSIFECGLQGHVPTGVTVLPSCPSRFIHLFTRPKQPWHFNSRLSPPLPVQQLWVARCVCPRRNGGSLWPRVREWKPCNCGFGSGGRVGCPPTSGKVSGLIPSFSSLHVEEAWPSTLNSLWCESWRCSIYFL